MGGPGAERAGGGDPSLRLTMRKDERRLPKNAPKLRGNLQRNHVIGHSAQPCTVPDPQIRINA